MTAIEHDKNVISASWFRYGSTAKVRHMDVRGAFLRPSVAPDLCCAEKSKEEDRYMEDALQSLCRLCWQEISVV